MSAKAPATVAGDAFLGVAVETSPNGVLVCDASGTVVYANPRLETIFRYAPQETLGLPVDRLLPGGLRESHAAKGLRKDGTEVVLEGFGLADAAHDGQPLVVASIVEVTERRRLGQRIRRESDRKVALERLLAELAAKFVNVPPESLDETIVDWQRKIVDALDIDRCVLWQFTEGDSELVYTHAWIRPESEPAPGTPTSRDQLFPGMLAKVRANELAWFSSIDDIPASLDRENLRSYGTKSTVVIPMSTADRVVGALSFASLRREWSMAPEELDRLKLVAAVFAQGLAGRKSVVAMRAAMAEIERLRDQLASENVLLRREVHALKAPRTIASESQAIRLALAKGEVVARTHTTVLLLGETGCGKEVFAEAIHETSRRRDRPMVRVSCASIPTALLESELFGRERGAYTGALSRQIGRFELAAGTTIFLDEIGELPLEAQGKLLRVLQEKTIERLGGIHPIKVDVRIIAATNRVLAKAVVDGTFREDLYYRLNVFPITVRPLRDRVEDIPILAWSFVDEFAKALNKRIDSISRSSIEALQSYAWPGNVRELRNVIERAVIVSSRPRLDIEIPAKSESGEATPGNRLSEVQSDHIRRVLARVGWRIRGAGGAASLLGMKPTTLESRMAKLGIQRPTPVG